MRQMHPAVRRSGDLALVVAVVAAMVATASVSASRAGLLADGWLVEVGGFLFGAAVFGVGAGAAWVGGRRIERRAAARSAEVEAGERAARGLPPAAPEQTRTAGPDELTGLVREVLDGAGTVGMRRGALIVDVGQQLGDRRPHPALIRNALAALVAYGDVVQDGAVREHATYRLAKHAGASWVQDWVKPEDRA